MHCAHPPCWVFKVQRCKSLPIFQWALRSPKWQTTHFNFIKSTCMYINSSNLTIRAACRLVYMCTRKCKKNTVKCMHSGKNNHQALCTQNVCRSLKMWKVGEDTASKTKMMCFCLRLGLLGMCWVRLAVLSILPQDVICKIWNFILWILF